MNFVPLNSGRLIFRPSRIIYLKSETFLLFDLSHSISSMHIILHRFPGTLKYSRLRIPRTISPNIRLSTQKIEYSTNPPFKHSYRYESHFGLIIDPRNGEWTIAITRLSDFQVCFSRVRVSYIFTFLMYIFFRLIVLCVYFTVRCSCTLYNSFALLKRHCVFPKMNESEFFFSFGNPLKR